MNEPPVNGPDEENTTLWTVSAGGFSATADAFAIGPPESPGAHHNLWFLSMVGPQSSLKSIWASLLNMPPQPAYLTPGAEGLVLNDELITCSIPPATLGTWTARITRMANWMGWHAMTYTRMAEYSFPKDDFLLITQHGEDPKKQHHRFLDRRVSLPLHRSWADWLWERGLENGEIKPLECTGIRAWHCAPAPTQLEADLSKAVAQGVLTLRESRAEDTEQEQTRKGQ